AGHAPQRAAARRVRGVEGGVAGGHAGARQRGRPRRRARELGRAGADLGTGAGAVLRGRGQATRGHARGGLRRDREGHGAASHPDRRRSGRGGRVPRVRPSTRHHRAGPRRERRKLVALMTAVATRIQILDPRAQAEGDESAPTYDLTRPMRGAKVGLRLDHSWRAYYVVVGVWEELLRRDGAEPHVLWTGERGGGEGVT